MQDEKRQQGREVILMYKTTNRDDQALLLTVEQASRLFGLGISAVRSRAKECGAELKIGKSVRIDREKFLEYLRTFES